ncbi:gamma-secretase subunit PEN-2 isoform X2 [Alosa pseudoharengus]|uniref:gamma-secretase subunit PEN-2 isoform X2 n=1 Tax=Alosa pseudoharengus TaxID=34774 RepID=UPI003F8C8D63
MNLERVPNEEKLSLCRKYYLGGFAFLPFLWLVNVVWFFREAFVKPTYNEQLQIKTSYHSIEEDAGNNRLVKHPEELTEDIEGPQPPQKM